MDEPKRRLAAVLAADVAGYSRLLSRDEAGTLQALRELRSALFEPVVTAHRGEVVKRMGDGWLVEFPSVVDAVNCAVKVQEGLAEHPVIKLRMGIHIGDIAHENEDIFGDGVNIAARLQDLTSPGTIAISDDVRRHSAGKIEAEFKPGGRRELKNIDEPVDVFIWGVPAESAVEDAPALPEKPSIAVLPFNDMSADPEQEYFIDGITEDIITQLARLRWLFVIARNSSFHYKGRSPDVRLVGRELGVRYVLEGSVRRQDKRIRITAQLIEAASGSHIWAERYDREITDIFALQDEITQAIAANVDTELAGSEREISRRKDFASLDAWDCYQRGTWYLYKSGKVNVAEARRWYQLAVQQDPEFAAPHGGLAYIGFLEVGMGYSDNPAASLAQGLRDAERALQLDERDAFSHFVLGRILTYTGDGRRAVRALERAIELNPNLAQGYYGLGFAHYWFGRAAEGLPHIDTAMRLSPHDPFLWSFYFFRGNCLFAMKKHRDAIADYEAALELGKGEFWPALGLACILGLQGKTEDAARHLERVVELRPGFTLAEVRALVQNLYPEYLDRLIRGLKHAGMPEE